MVSRRLRLVAAFALLACAPALPGCSGRDEAPGQPGGMTLEQLDRLTDTTGLSRGPARFERLAVARGADGIVRARGAMEFPDGTVGQLVVYADAAPLSRIPFRLVDGRFEDVVVAGPGGRLASGRYRVEVTVMLNATSQSPAVMRALGDPARLRGPGITRDRTGGAAFTHAGEFEL